MFIKLLVFAIKSTLFEGEGVYILIRVTEKWQESEINITVWVFQLLLAGIVAAQSFKQKPSLSSYIMS